jgi:hypothetical protein
VFLAGLLLLPAIFWARLHRKRHTLRQAILPPVLVCLLTPTVYLIVMDLLGPR